MQLCAKWLFDAELVVQDVQYQGYVNMHFAIYTSFNIKWLKYINYFPVVQVFFAPFQQVPCLPG